MQRRNGMIFTDEKIYLVKKLEWKGVKTLKAGHVLTDLIFDRMGKLFLIVDELQTCCVSRMCVNKIAVALKINNKAWNVQFPDLLLLELYFCGWNCRQKSACQQHPVDDGCQLITRPSLISLNRNALPQHLLPFEHRLRICYKKRRRGACVCCITAR